LSTLDIEDYLNLKPWGKWFLGVVPRDMIGQLVRDNPQMLNLKKKWYIVINLDDSQSAGSHWVALASVGDGRAYYYDSLSVEPPQEVLNIWGNKVYHQTELHQCPDTSLCGFYVLRFINHLFGNVSNRKYKLKVK